MHTLYVTLIIDCSLMMQVRDLCEKTVKLCKNHDLKLPKSFSQFDYFVNPSNLQSLNAIPSVDAVSSPISDDDNSEDEETDQDEDEECSDSDTESDDEDNSECEDGDSDYDTSSEDEDSDEYDDEYDDHENSD
jgi:hypothetical protein